MFTANLQRSLCLSRCSTYMRYILAHLVVETGEEKNLPVLDSVYKEKKFFGTYFDLILPFTLENLDNPSTHTLFEIKLANAR